mmetsp:Transcript_105115/g.338952  ORF Transcript_105115/g.338952 Transcript_105115/m.338952 type:complete len:92 (-) Transcript_105115:283-558(-)
MLWWSTRMLPNLFRRLWWLERPKAEEQPKKRNTTKLDEDVFSDDDWFNSIPKGAAAKAAKNRKIGFGSGKRLSCCCALPRAEAEGICAGRA